MADPHAADVKILLLGDGANESVAIVDSSSASRTPELNNGVSNSTAEKKFGIGALAALSAGGRLDYGLSADFDLPQQFTIEWWMYMPAPVSGLFMAASTGRFMRLVADSGGAQESVLHAQWYGEEVGVALSTTVPCGQWVHIAFAREYDGGNGYTTRLFKNGVSVGTSSNGTSAAGSHRLGIFSIPNSTAYPSFVGRLDEVRYTRGVCRYTANFTPAPIAESYLLSGHVKTGAGAALARTVRAYLRSTGEYVAGTTSDAGTGAFSLAVPTQGQHTVVCLDDADNALIFDRVVPSAS